MIPRPFHASRASIRFTRDSGDSTISVFGLGLEYLGEEYWFIIIIQELGGYLKRNRIGSEFVGNLWNLIPPIPVWTMHNCLLDPSPRQHNTWVTLRVPPPSTRLPSFLRGGPIIWVAIRHLCVWIAGRANRLSTKQLELEMESTKILEDFPHRAM